MFEELSPKLAISPGMKIFEIKLKKIPGESVEFYRVKIGNEWRPAFRSPKSQEHSVLASILEPYCLFTHDTY